MSTGMDWQGAAATHRAAEEQRVETLQMLKGSYGVDVTMPARFPLQFSDSKMKEEFLNWYRAELGNLQDEELSQFSTLTWQAMRELTDERGSLCWRELEEALTVITCEMRDRNLKRGLPIGKWFDPEVTAEMKLTEELSPVFTGYRQVAKRIIDEIKKKGEAEVLRMVESDLAYFGKLKRTPGKNKGHVIQVVREAVKGFATCFTQAQDRNAAE